MRFQLKFWSFSLVMFLFVFEKDALGQSSTEQRLANLRNVVPPSPNASSLGKYGDWPVSLYTGVPDISIPVTALVGRSVSIPVSLSYHAAGNKVGEIASWVGLGWNLNAGGMISRSVRGLPDESGYFSYSSNYLDPDNLTSPIAENYVSTRKVATANNLQDSEQDIYSLSALGKSYKFLLKSDGVVLTMPYSKVKVVSNPIVGSSTKSTDDSWTIIFEDGTKMIFGTSGFLETTSNNSMGMLYTSSWLLKTIISPVGESVNFKYSFTFIDQDAYFSQTDFIQYANNVDAYCVHVDKSAAKITTVSKQGVNTSSLSTIESDLGRIEFITGTAARLDLRNGQVLSEVKVYSKLLGRYVEDFVFNTSYTQAVSSVDYSADINGGDAGFYQNRLRLNSFEKKSVATPASPSIKWSFDYNTQNLPSRRSFAQDHWGFFNGAINNTTLLPTVYAPIPSYIDQTLAFPDGGNRAPDEDFTQAEILTSIQYPTGGTSHFIYEGNKIPVAEEKFVTTGIELLMNITNQNSSNTSKIQTFTITKPQTVIITNESRIVGNIDQQDIVTQARIRNSSGDIIGTITGTGSITLDLPTPGLYSFEVFSNVDPSSVATSQDHVQMNARLSYERSLGMQSFDKLLGGLRIKSITSGDGATPGSILVKSFKYENPLIINPIETSDYITEQQIWNYISSVNVHCYATKLLRNSSTKFALGSIQGGTVGYSKVTTLQGFNGENGKIVTTFSSEPDAYEYESKIFPYSAPDSREWRRGLILTQSYFDANEKILKQDSNTYDFVAQGRIVGFKAGYVQSFPNEWCLDRYRDCGIGVSYSYTSTEQVRHLSTTEKDYDQDGKNFLSKTTDYFYDNPNNLQPTRIETNDSKGNIIRTVNRTPLEKADINIASPLSDEASLAIDSMITRNIITPVIQQERHQKKSDENTFSLLNRSLTDYKMWDDVIIAPRFVKLQQGSNPPEVRVQFNKYDTYGNLLEEQKTNDVINTYLYGYKSSVMVERILGVSHSNVAALVDLNILDNPSSAQVLRVELDKIRSGLGNTQTSTTGYTYDPLIGMTSETNERNRTTYYEYDSFNRLKSIRDHEGNILKIYDYKYGN